jgi:hypothetical protein
MPEGDDNKPLVATVDPSLVEALHSVAATLRDNARPAPAAEQKPQEYTRAGLREAVTQGRITQDQADLLWDEQLSRKVTEKAVAAARETTQTEQTVGRIENELARYEAVIPAAKDTNSPEFKRIKAEFDYLVSIGLPKTKQTELAAARNVFGKIDALEAAARNTGSREHDAGDHGGGAGSDGGGEGSVWKGVPADHRAYYREQIAKGFYSGENDPRLVKLLDRVRSRKKAA